MKKRTKTIILTIALMQIALIIGLMAAPRVVQAIPTRYLMRLPDGLVEPFLPPLPDLPPPQQNRQRMGEDRPRITIPAAALENEAAATPTLTPTPESENAPAAAEEVSAEPSPTPSLTPSPMPSPTPTPLPIQAQIEGLEVERQGFNNCGPANLTQILTFYGNELTQAEAAAYLKPNPEDRNVSSWQMSDYVNDFTTLRSTAHSGGNLELIKRFVAEGFPVIIAKGYEPDIPSPTGWMGHYFTVYGYDDENETLDVLDTYLAHYNRGRQSVDYETINHYWQQFNYTFFVVYEPENEEIVHAILGEEMLDRDKMWRNAALRAQEEIEADPDNPFAWFNLGTSLTRLGERTGEMAYYQGAAEAFDEARSIGLPPRMLWYQHRPLMAYWRVGRADDVMELIDTTLQTLGGQTIEELYWYRGHILLERGDISGARTSYQQALRLNENFYPAQISLDYVNSLGP